MRPRLGFVVRLVVFQAAMQDPPTPTSSGASRCGSTSNACCITPNSFLGVETYKQVSTRNWQDLWINEFSRASSSGGFIRHGSCHAASVIASLTWCVVAGTPEIRRETPPEFRRGLVS